MKWLLTLVLMLSWSGFMYAQGYRACKLEWVETQRAEYEATIEKLTNARNEVAEQARRYRDAAQSVRAESERLQHELTAAQARARDKRTATPKDTCGRSEAMESVLREATALIAERDTIALQFNELREQCRLR